MYLHVTLVVNQINELYAGVPETQNISPRELPAVNLYR